MNRLELDARLTRRDALRYTPAGFPVLDFELSHASQAQEAGSERTIECVVEAIVFGDLAKKISTVDLNSALRLSGFLANRSLKSRQLKFHVTQLIEEV